ncbi:MAG: radical SAM protein, partial [Thermodesulfobacteriota bacterium]
PDALSPDTLQDFKELGLDMVELGIQTFSEDVLTVSNRGYGSDTAIRGCRLVKQAGMQLGIQLLPGLPLHDKEKWLRDITGTIRERPSLVRIYPCLTIKGTKLAKWWEQGRYSPWSLAETLELLTRGVFKLWRNKIKVNRLGLPPEKEMLDRLLAGPWHPSLGDIVQSRILYYLILTNRLILGTSRLELFSPRKYQGILWGYKGMNREKLNNFGINSEIVTFWDKDYFQLQSLNNFS